MHESSRATISFQAMKKLILFLSLIVSAFSVAVAEDLDGRTAFLTPPGRDISAALKRADTEHKRVLVFIVDPGRKEGFHIRGTMDAPETKKLVKDNFLVVIIPSSKEKHVAGLVDDTNPMHPSYVVFNADGTVVAKGDAAMGGANGFNWIKQLIATP